MMKKLLSPIFRKMRPAPHKFFQRPTKAVHEPEEFHELIKLERDRVHRDHQQFSLILIRVDEPAPEFASVNDLVHTIAKRVRRIDQVGWYDTNHLGVLLPNTTNDGAQIIAKDISSAQDDPQKAGAVETLSYPMNHK